jgi:hypothetical protein
MPKATPITYSVTTSSTHPIVSHTIHPTIQMHLRKCGGVGQANTHSYIFDKKKKRVKGSNFKRSLNTLVNSDVAHEENLPLIFLLL